MCLAVVAVWALVAAWQALAVFPWDQGGVYAEGRVGRVRRCSGGDRHRPGRVAFGRQPTASVSMTQSPYDRTAAFISARYRRNPVAFCAVVLAAAWALWTLYEVLSAPSSGFGWYLQAREVILEVGNGLIVAAGVVWLVEVMRRHD